MEASGERTTHYSKDKMLAERPFELPALHSLILSDPLAKVSHVFSPAYNLAAELKGVQDSSFIEVMNKLEIVRPGARQSDEVLMAITKWDMAEREEQGLDPLRWLGDNLPRTLARYEDFSLIKQVSYYQVYQTGAWQIGHTEDGKSVPYVQRVELKPANALVHWLYRAATGLLLFPEKEPKPPPNSFQKMAAIIKRFLMPSGS